MQAMRAGASCLQAFSPEARGRYSDDSGGMAQRSPGGSDSNVRVASAPRPLHPNHKHGSAMQCRFINPAYFIDCTAGHMFALQATNAAVD